VFEIFVAVLFCRGVAVGNLRQRDLFEVGAVAKIDNDRSAAAIRTEIGDML
jgi:hypothetical protein